MMFDDVVAGHAEWLARLAFRFCPRKEDAADLAQDTLVRILTYRDRYDVTRDFKPWALTIMTNIYKNRIAHDSLIPFQSLEDVERPSTQSADSRAIFRDTARAVRESARECSGVECVLLYAEGYNYDEIAKMKDICAGTVKSRVANGRKAIARALGYYGS